MNDLTQTPNENCSQRNHGQGHDQDLVIFCNFENDAHIAHNISDEFHPVVSLEVMRDDVGKGVSSALARPAGELCKHDSPRVQWFPLAVPPHSMVADARAVVANPEQFHDRPLLRRLAWMTLMTARGLTVDQNRLAQMPVEMGR
jgi:hypothetical protein